LSFDVEGSDPGKGRRATVNKQFAGQCLHIPFYGELALRENDLWCSDVLDVAAETYRSAEFERTDERNEILQDDTEIGGCLGLLD